MLILDRVTKRFGDLVAVSDLSLEAGEGEILSLLGPNGAGKTTTIKMIAGLLRPTAGRIRIGGFDVQREPLEAKRLLGYIPDRLFFYEKLTGEELLEFVADIYGVNGRERRHRLDRLISQFRMESYIGQFIESYSQGMRQKLAFCSCFLHDPKVVVIDEPWVGLDPRSIRFIINFLKGWAGEGSTVFISTHSLAIAEEISHRTMIIHKGKLVASGRVGEILALKAAGNFEEVFLALTAEEPMEE
jgi:ABC-2 type transport system ATP-binding protein